MSFGQDDRLNKDVLELKGKFFFAQSYSYVCYLFINYIDQILVI